jgi:predicted HTH transcriptional regulator
MVDAPAVPGDTGHDPDVPSNVPGDIDLNERQVWIVAQTGKGAEVQRRTVETRFNVSAKTAKRDFSRLAKRGLIEYIRTPHPGFYRQKQ